MPTFTDKPTDKPTSKPAKNDLFEVLHDGGTTEPSIAKVSMAEIAKLDPLLAKAQQLVQASVPDIKLGWLGAAYDMFGTQIRLILAYNTAKPAEAHLFLFDDDQITIIKHLVDHPLTIVAEANAIAQEYMHRKS